MAIMVLTKRMKWGLLCKVRNVRGRWRWVNTARFIFDTKVEAYEQATEFNVSDGGYVYKPVAVDVVAEYEE